MASTEVGSKHLNMEISPPLVDTSYFDEPFDQCDELIGPDSKDSSDDNDDDNDSNANEGSAHSDDNRIKSVHSQRSALRLIFFVLPGWVLFSYP